MTWTGGMARQGKCRVGGARKQASGTARRFVLDRVT
jgi:hypothetical protein